MSIADLCSERDNRMFENERRNAIGSIQRPMKVRFGKWFMHKSVCMNTVLYFGDVK